MTVFEFVSIIKEGVNLYTGDLSLPNDYIYDIGVSNAELLNKREAEKEIAFNNISSLSRVELELVYVKDCDNVKVSKDSLPEFLKTAKGSQIAVFNPTMDNRIYESDPLSYLNVRNLKFKSKNNYYWIEDNKLKLPNTKLTKVILYYVPSAVNITAKEAEAAKNKTCFNILDQEMPIISYLESELINMTNQFIINKLKILVDEKTNLNSNVKN